MGRGKFFFKGDWTLEEAMAQLLHEGSVDTLLYSASCQGDLWVQLDTWWYSDTVASEWQNHWNQHHQNNKWPSTVNLMHKLMWWMQASIGINSYWRSGFIPNSAMWLINNDIIYSYIKPWIMHKAERKYHTPAMQSIICTTMHVKSNSEPP